MKVCGITSKTILIICAFVPAFTLAQTAPVRPPRGRFVKIANTPAVKQSLRTLSPLHSDDYGAFTWMELSDADMARLAEAGTPFEDHSNEFELNLGGVVFDPLRGEPPVPASWNRTATTGPELHLVQFIGPTRAEWLKRLEADGIRVLQYIHPYTYVVWCESDALSASRAATEIRWSGDFLPAYRVQPQWRSLPAGDVDARLMVYRGADLRRVIGDLAGLGAKINSQGTIDATFESLRVSLPADKVLDAAGIAGVYALRPVPTDGGLRGEMSDQINVGNYNGSNLAFPGYQTYLASLGLNGAGVIIANVDSGVQQNHPDLQNRILSCVGTTCAGAASSAHGTHTAGIMAGDGASGTLDARGFLRGLGVAPGANLIEQNYSPYYLNAGGMLQLMTDSSTNGAKVSGNSWGPAGSPQGYDDDTRQVDVGVRDANTVAAGNQPLTYVLSIMNGNGGTSTQGSPDEAKNIITIGSTKMQNSADGSQILLIDDISSNSAHGPALDGRKIPHMVAPGCYVDSTYTTSTWSLQCGTSMASPQVSGAAALFIQYFRNLPGYTADPSPALIKAAFLPVAHDLAGHLDANSGTLGHPFDSKQGWGRMDLRAVIAPDVSVRYFDSPQIFDNTGDEWRMGVTAADPSKPLKVMLVWTDAPGHGLGGATPAWNNNLDLTVEDPSNSYLGNNFGPSGWSVAGGTPDIMNNTEGVFIGPTASGNFTIRVTAANINSDGIPNQGDATDQDFAVVCYNCAQNSGFTLAATPNSRSICAPAPATYSINIGQVMGFVGPVTLSVNGNPAGTTATFAPNPATTPGTSTLTISNTAAAAPGAYTLTINGVSGAISRAVDVTLKINTAVPTAPVLATPANGSTDVALTPALSWNAATQGTTYEVQVATDGAFSNIVAGTVGLWSTSFNVSPALQSGATYFWRVRSTNTCGTGPWSSSFYFNTRLTPSILLVDDDDNTPDVRGAYTAALDALGWTYDVWDTNNSDVEPTLAQLTPYSAVIWFTGDAFGGPCGPSAATETALSQWLITNKCFFISSQDYMWDRGGTGHNTPTAFMATYLGVANPATSDVGHTVVTGAPGSVFAGLGPYTLAYPFINYSDRISPGGAAAILSFSGNNGDAGTQKNAINAHSIYLGFPFEAIPTAADRQSVMARALANCVYPCPTVKGDINATGGVNGADIAGFTRCFTAGTPLSAGCRCADMDGDNAFTAADVTSFVNCLLGISCP